MSFCNSHPAHTIHFSPPPAAAAGEGPSTWAAFAESSPWWLCARFRLVSFTGIRDCPSAERNQLDAIAKCESGGNWSISSAAAAAAVCSSVGDLEGQRQRNAAIGRPAKADRVPGVSRTQGIGAWPSWQVAAGTPSRPRPPAAALIVMVSGTPLQVHGEQCRGWAAVPLSGRLGRGVPGVRPLTTAANTPSRRLASWLRAGRHRVYGPLVSSGNSPPSTSPGPVGRRASRSRAARGTARRGAGDTRRGCHGLADRAGGRIVASVPEEMAARARVVVTAVGRTPLRTADWWPLRQSRHRLPPTSPARGDVRPTKYRRLSQTDHRYRGADRACLQLRFRAIRT